VSVSVSVCVCLHIKLMNTSEAYLFFFKSKLLHIYFMLHRFVRASVQI